MDNLCADILNYLRYKGCDYICYFTPDSFNAVCERLRVPVDLAKMAVKHLEEQGFLEYLKDPRGSAYGFTLSYKGLHYEDYIKDTPEDPLPQQIFNIQEVHNSAFGNNGSTFTISTGVSFDEIRESINTQDIPDTDKDRLEALADLAETNIENEVPMKKGCFHRFGDLFLKYGKVCSQILGNLLPYFLRK